MLHLVGLEYFQLLDFGCEAFDDDRCESLVKSEPLFKDDLLEAVFWEMKIGKHVQDLISNGTVVVNEAENDAS